MSASDHPPEDEREAARGDNETDRKLKRDFLANMSHEMRTPLNAIIGMTDLTLGTRLSGKQRDYLEVIRSSSKALLGLINDILDFSKIDSGKLSMESIAFVLPRVLEEAMGVVRAEATRKGLWLENILRDGTPEALTGDPARLKQVLINLLSNAVKFTAAGGVRLETALETASDGEIVLRFTVTDTGIGISQKAARKLFTPFSQADGSTSRTYGGTGLGLAISDRLVRLMGGAMGVSSQPGKGSAFSFTARFEMSREIGRKERPQPSSALAAPDRDALARLRGANVLLAEDNAANLTALFEILRCAGIGVEAAENGRRAVDKARANRFDAALMDVRMPVMDGLEAARAIRNLPGGMELPIIALTADAMRGDRERCLEAGMDDYLPKPVTRDALLGALARWVGAKRGPGQVDAAARDRTDSAATGPAPDPPSPSSPSASPSSPSLRGAGGRHEGPPPADVPVLDVREARRRRALSKPPLAAACKDFLRDFKIFGESLRVLLDDLGEGDGRGDLAGATDEAALAAHRLAGAAGDLGAARVRAAALRLESVLLAERLGEASGALDEAETELAALTLALERLFLDGDAAITPEPDAAGHGAKAPENKAAPVGLLCDRLAVGLDEADPVASAEGFEALRSALAAPSGDPGPLSPERRDAADKAARLLGQLGDRIEDYDMDLARKTLDALRLVLSGPDRGKEEAGP